MRKSFFSHSERRALDRIKHKHYRQKQHPGSHRQVTYVPERLFVDMDLGKAMLLFFLAPDWAAACPVLEEHPILLTAPAIELLRDVAAELQVRQATEDAAIMRSHLAVLEYARDYGIEAVLHGIG